MPSAHCPLSSINREFEAEQVCQTEDPQLQASFRGNRTLPSMAKSPRGYSSGRVLPFRSAFQRSISPLRQFAHSSSDEMSSNSAPSSFHRPSSPPRLKIHGFAPLGPSVQFPISRSRSPRRLMAVSPRDQFVQKQSNSYLPKKTCACSPTTHSGSFRCSLHKNPNTALSMSYSANRLNARRWEMASPVVRIGTVEGGLVKRALAQLIRPSSHQQRRRFDFQPRPSRLSIMSKADDP